LRGPPLKETGVLKAMKKGIEGEKKNKKEAIFFERDGR